MNSFTIGDSFGCPASTTISNQCRFSSSFTSLSAPGLTAFGDGVSVVALAMDAQGNIKTGGSIVSSGTVGDTTITTKGDLLTSDGVNNIRLPVGTDGQVLTAQPDGSVAWEAIPGGGTSSSPNYVKTAPFVTLANGETKTVVELKLGASGISGYFGPIQLRYNVVATAATDIYNMKGATTVVFKAYNGGTPAMSTLNTRDTVDLNSTTNPYSWNVSLVDGGDGFDYFRITLSVSGIFTTTYASGWIEYDFTPIA
jgi:hypothetical protein